ncbi:MAG: permease [Candidatus Methanofastidiosa archaeon]|nr:permease [Candidatus Methanofastidiosa archaeon]
MGYASRALASGIEELVEYLSAHTLTCLVPAFFIAGAIAVFVSKQSVIKYFGCQTKRYISYGVASVSGCVLAACSCTVIPLFAGISRRGAGIGPATTFLYSGPAINILAISLTAKVLGYEIGVARAVMAIIMAIAIGLIMELLFEDRSKADSAKAGICVAEEAGTGRRTILLFVNLVLILLVGTAAIGTLIKIPLVILLIITAALMTFYWVEREEAKMWGRETLSLFKMIFPLLLIGVFTAGLIKEFMPPEYVARYVGSNSLVSNLVASVAGAFMYFATLTEVPIIESLTSLGMHKGPELALLLAGPALSLPNMLAIRKVMGTKKTAVYVSLVIVFATVSGIGYGML